LKEKKGKKEKRMDAATFAKRKEKKKEKRRIMIKRGREGANQSINGGGKGKREEKSMQRTLKRKEKKWILLQKGEGGQGRENKRRGKGGGEFLFLGKGRVVTFPERRGGKKIQTGKNEERGGKKGKKKAASSGKKGGSEKGEDYKEKGDGDFIYPSSRGGKKRAGTLTEIGGGECRGKKGQDMKSGA